MKNFLIFLKNAYLSNFTSINLFFVILIGFYDFNNAKNEYMALNFIYNRAWENGFNQLLAFGILLTACLMIYLAYMLIKGKFTAKVFKTSMLVFNVIGFIILFLMLYDLNEMAINCGYYSTTMIMGYIHHNDNVTYYSDSYNYLKNINFTGV